MKKYVKPELFYERFELTEHVAACKFDHENNSTSPKTCAFVGDSDTDWPGWVVFTDSVTDCVYKVQDYCYYPGANGMNTFNS